MPGQGLRYGTPTAGPVYRQRCHSPMPPGPTEEKSVGGGDLFGELGQPEARSKRNRREEEVGLRLEPSQAYAQGLRERLVL